MLRLFTKSRIDQKAGQWIFAALCVFVLTACGGSGGSGKTNVKPMAAYCPFVASGGASISGDFVTISGTAAYEYRENGNGAVKTGADALPIRNAEIRISNSSGIIIQCAETSNTGTFTFKLQKNSGDYDVRVVSRASNAANTAYIMNNPTDNDFYSLDRTVSSAGDDSSLAFLAKATDTMEGAAFNIMDQINKAQDYLRAQTADCGTGSGSDFPGCTKFTTAQVVFVYWSKGVSPSVYYGGSGAISYYLGEGKRQLYILGGMNGDAENSDMDHFDNSVIVHEYGHFIEDQFGKPNSPGGSHNGNSIIDPRLAWGEGWANFFQAAVLGNAVYRDTYGHVGCTGSAMTSQGCTGVLFNVPIVRPAPVGMTGQDLPTVAGEGIFREFSVARALLNAIDGPGSFAELWAAFHSSSTSMRTVDDPFKSIARLHKIQSDAASATNWSTVRTPEYQKNILEDYARPLATCSSSSVPLTIIRSSSDTGSISTTNLLQNNDFYSYYHSGGNISLRVDWTASGSEPADFDLFFYKTNYVMGDDSTMAFYSIADGVGFTGSDSASGNAPAGWYMINVQAYTGLTVKVGSTVSYRYDQGVSYPTTYTLKINGQTVCP